MTLIIEPSTIFFGGEENPNWFSPERALAQLLLDETVFLDDDLKPFVNINDCYVLGSDGIDLKESELAALYKCWQEDSTFGSVKWASLKLKEQPRQRIVAEMKKRGIWDDQMEALPACGCIY